MTNFRLYIFSAILFVSGIYGSCSKLDTSGPTNIIMEPKQITTSTAVVNVILLGDMPSSCKITVPFLEDDLTPESLSEDYLYRIVQAEGKEIHLPCETSFSDLISHQTYHILLAYDSRGEKHAQYISFKTLAASGDLTIILNRPDAQWKEGDTAGMFSYDIEGTPNVNTPLVLDNASVEKTEGQFIAQRTIQLPKVGSDRFFFYYPKDDVTFFSDLDYKMHSYLSPEQILGEDISTTRYYWGITEVQSNSTTLNVHMENALAAISFEINTMRYPGYTVSGISLADENGTAQLSGEFTIDPDNGAVQPFKGNSLPNISMSREISPNVSQEIVLPIIPGDYSEADLRLFITMVSQNGTNMVIPMLYPGTLIAEPGEKIICRIDDPVPDSTVYPWYEPQEQRDYLGKCAYGPQNTFCIECKASGQNTISFDVKARGNILEAQQPKYYGILLPSDIKDGKFLILSDGTDYYEPAPIREIPEDWKITVACYDQNQAEGGFGVIAIYDANHNILWSYMIWRYNEGDPISEVYYPGGNFTIMDRVLGGRKSISKGVTEGALGEGAAYFEWGRKDPFPWCSQVPEWYSKATPPQNCGIDWSVAHPNIWITYSATKTWFHSDQRKDLWGNENTQNSNNTEIIGHKTIYDPCPEGWRVCDYSVCHYVHSGKVFAERVADPSERRYRVQSKNTDLHLAMECPFSDISTVAIDKGDGTYDYWPFHGIMWGSTNNWANNSLNATDYAYAYWSNSNNSASNYKASLFLGYYTSTSWTMSTSLQMADMFTVRCQKETKTE